jgi:hypothetical protein
MAPAWGEFSPYGVAATVVALLLMSASMAAFAQRGATFTPASPGDGDGDDDRCRGDSIGARIS